MTAEPVAPTELRKTVPYGIEAATLRALQKLPADRYKRTDSDATNLIAATVDLAGEPRVVTREVLFNWADYEGDEPHANYDVLPGDREFVMVRRTQVAHLVLIQNVHALVHGAE